MGEIIREDANIEGKVTCKWGLTTKPLEDRKFPYVYNMAILKLSQNKKGRKKIPGAA